MDWLIVVVVVQALVCAAVSYYFARKYLSLRENFRNLMFQKKSSETRMGLVGEQFSPYIKDWPFGDPKEFRLLSHPIDGINFGQHKITFVEIKTGKSRLSKNQKRIKDLIKTGKVDFVEFRIGEEGCETKSTKADAKVLEPDCVDE